MLMRGTLLPPGGIMMLAGSALDGKIEILLQRLAYQSRHAAPSGFREPTSRSLSSSEFALALNQRSHRRSCQTRTCTMPPEAEILYPKGTEPEFQHYASGKWLAAHDTRVVVLGAVVGLVSGLAAVAFDYSLYSYGGKSLQPFGHLQYLIAPIIGALIAGPVIARLAQEAEGHGIPEVMTAIVRHGGRARPRVGPVKFVASAFTIGTGGSSGREGPIAQPSGSLASLLEAYLHPHPLCDWWSNRTATSPGLRPQTDLRARARWGVVCFPTVSKAGEGTERNGTQFFGLAHACGPVRRRKPGEAGERVCASKLALRVRVQVLCEQAVAYVN
jgi:Voltage gated chloride channel